MHFEDKIQDQVRFGGFPESIEVATIANFVHIVCISCVYLCILQIAFPVFLSSASIEVVTIGNYWLSKPDPLFRLFPIKIESAFERPSNLFALTPKISFLIGSRLQLQLHKLVFWYKYKHEDYLRNKHKCLW